jgi:hypothetical protein
VDLAEGFHPVIRYNLECGRLATAFERKALKPNFQKKEESSVPRPSPGKLIGLLFGGLVVGVMLFMMFMLLGNLFIREQ